MNYSISPRLTLLIIAAMFLLPLMLAWLMYSGTLSYEPGSGRNLGTLIKPPVLIDWHDVNRVKRQKDTQPALTTAADELLEHWVILYPVPAICDAACQQRVSSLRQIHRATGRHQSRVRLALLLDDTSPGETAKTLQAMYEKFTLIRDPCASLSKALAAIPAGTPGMSATKGDIYLIDPLGNIMMYYAADADPNHIRKDLKRLLTWSKLDEQQ